MSNQDDFQFDGFEPANTTPVPDVLFDILLSKLSGAEIKVLLYIIRRTWGFKKQTDAISLSQLQNGIKTREGKILDSGCGIKRRETICEALASLERKKCIFSQKGKTSYNDNDTTIYGIYFKQGVVSKPDYPQERGSFKTGLQVVSKPDQGSPITGLGVVSKPDPQETVIQETEFQKTVIQLESSGNILTHPTFASYDATLSQENKVESLKPQEATEPLILESQVIPSQENKAPEIEAQAQNKQANRVSDSQKTTRKSPKQQVLIEKPKQPQMPPATMAWGPEKMVQITEARRFSRDKQGAYFSDEIPAKSKTSQRQRQLEAAKKILALDITEEQYIRAYDQRNDAWWNKKGSLTVEDMYAKTTKGVIRILEVLEGLESKSTLNGNVRSFPSTSQQQPPVPAACMSHDEACKLAHDAITQAKQYGYDIQAQAVTSKKVEGAWIVKVKWDNEDGFVVPPIRTREQWQKEFKSIHENLSIQTLALAKREAK
jgi:hypothetical protein